VCENTPLDVCPTQACRQWREEIRLRLAQGWTEQQILDYFVEQYGYRVLAEPPRSGFNWLVYIVPPLLFLIGSFILYRAFRSWRSSEPEIPEEGEETLSEPKKEKKKDKYVSQLEEELRKRG
jgi:cytochrome c-type biogenesis protein CcmH